MLPTGPETAREHFDFFRDVNRPEDIALVESVQRGLHSRASRSGPLVVDPALDAGWSEHDIHRFHTLVLESLEPDPS